MKLDPQPTKAEIRVARTYCVIVAVLTGIPAGVALQLKGLLSWQFLLFAVIVLFFLLAAFAFPARARVAFVRFAPWP
jgi:hypothetical protein